VKSEAIACAWRCQSSWLTRWWTPKEWSEKWRAKEEERHKGSLTPKKQNDTVSPMLSLLAKNNHSLLCISSSKQFQRRLKFELEIRVTRLMSLWKSRPKNSPPHFFVKINAKP
jgi:hypothetical protein